MAPLAPAPVAVAADLIVERVEPPSWWSEPRAQEITLLIEGSGLRGARVATDYPGLRIGRVEEGAEGRALFVEATVAAGAKPGPIPLTIEGAGPPVRRPWTLLARPEGRPHPLGPDDVVYLIMPDRFADGDATNNDPDAPGRLLDRSHPQAYHGGDFRGIREKLPYLADLGVTALWLTPVYRPALEWFETPTEGGKLGRFSDFHGYSPVGFYDTNPRFGSFAEYRALVDEAHRLGLKVLQDQILGYTGRGHRWLHRPPGEGWYHGPIDRPPACTFRYDALANPHATEAERRGVTDGWFFGLIPDLDTRNPRVRRYAIQQSIWWTTLAGADGIRLDTYPLVERDFWRGWSARLKALHPEIRVIGEAWTLDPADLSFFQGGRTGWDGIDPGIDTVFDFPLYGAIRDVFSGKAPATALPKALARDGLYPRPDLLVTFVDNHDTPRLAAEPGVTPARLRLAAAFLLTTRGIPQMTWGDEIGLPGHMDDRRDFPGGFPGDPRDAFTAEGRSPNERATFNAWRTLLHLRKATPALRLGRLVDLAASDTAYAFLREHEGQRIVTALNLAVAPASIRIPPGRLEALDAPARLYGDGRAVVDASGLTVELPAESVGIFRLVPPEGP